MKRRVFALLLCVALVLMSAVSVSAYPIAAESTDAVSPDEAVVLLREAFKQRQTSFTVTVTLPTANIIEAMQMASPTAQAISDAALEHTGKPDEGDYIAMSVARYEARYVVSAASMEMNYTIEYYDDADQEAAVDEEAARILKSLALSGKTDYEKVCAIYDYVCSTVEYDYTDDGTVLKHSAYASFILHKSVCQGYTLELYRLLLAAGVDCRIVSGFDESGEGHGWNLIRLGSKYYFADATWDAGRSRYKFFLKGTEDFEEHGEYAPDDRTQKTLSSVPLAGSAYDPSLPDADPGDANADGALDTLDVIHLLYHAFFPETYPIYSDCDFDASGKVDAGDAAHLLYHLFFPRLYPLFIQA